MKKVRAFTILLVIVLIFSLTPPASAITTPVSVLYVMNYLSPETSTDYTLNDIKSSGFDTVIVFSVDGTSTGDLTFFGTPVFTGGNYVGPAGWPAKIASLKTGTTSVTRLGFCLGGNYNTYRTYMNTYGTGPTTNWYKNFAKLKELTNADFIDFNDENCYDAASLTQLGNMMDAIGYKVSLCPYNNPTVWRTVKSNLGSIVDMVNLQCYDGGYYNNVGTWNTYFGGLKVTPLFWTNNGSNAYKGGISASQVEAWVSSKASAYGITSAGCWQYSDIRDYNYGTAAEYNAALRAGLGGGNPPTGSTVQVALTSYFNADGFSYDTDRSDGNLDDSGYTYSANIVNNTPTYNNVSFQLGSFANDVNNVVDCTGQTIDLTDGNYSSICILGSSTNGNKSGTIRMNYTDSTYTNTTVNMKDWCVKSGTVVQTMNHRHSQTADQYTTNYIYLYTLTPSSSKTLTSIKLPNNADMHIYAITLVE